MLLLFPKLTVKLPAKLVAKLVAKLAAKLAAKLTAKLPAQLAAKLKNSFMGSLLLIFWREIFFGNFMLQKHLVFVVRFFTIQDYWMKDLTTFQKWVAKLR